ncbi:hypothetical protein DH2020_041177 [Rehmannia glutinosa]|uniref:Uncharacterized protein n=1 Tax=Rehmannia glutinosa TaxID=99300 RepID=A0ABR0URK2_REHGL
MPGQKIETGHQDIVHDVAMDYFGKRLATASSDNTIKIIGVSNSGSQHLATLTGHQGPVLTFSTTTKRRSILFLGHLTNSAFALRVDPRMVTSRSSLHDPMVDGTNRESTRRIRSALPPFRGPVHGSVLVGSGLLDPVQKLASGGCDNTVKVWKFDNGIWRMDCFPALKMHTDWVRDVAWAPNLGLPKSTIASASQDGKVIIWTAIKEGDQWDGKVLKDFGGPVWRVSWSLTGNILAVADGKNNVTLWKEAVDGEWQQVTTVES